MKTLSQIAKENELTVEELHKVIGIMHKKGWAVYIQTNDWKTSYERAFEVYTKRYVRRFKQHERR